MNTVPTLAPEVYAAQAFAPLTADDYRERAAAATTRAGAHRLAAGAARGLAEHCDTVEARSGLLDVAAYDDRMADREERRAAAWTAKADGMGE